MIIGIVLHPYGEDKPAGLARTIFEFTKALIANDPRNEYIIFLKKEPRVAPDLPGKNWRLVVLGEGLLWLERLRRAPRADIYVFNTPVMPLWWRPRRAVVLALDFAYKYFPPDDFRGRIRNHLMELYHRRSLRRADRIITMSEATKHDVIRFFHISPSKIQAVHWGFKQICNVAAETVDVPADFFLFVGVMKERKNVLNVVKGFRTFARHHTKSRHALVLCGKGEGAYVRRLKDYIRDEGIANRVIFPGYLTEGQVAYLYRHATALVFPSFVEGFGFPVLEAMDCGTPVITSDRSSLAELGAGGAALLVDPYQPERIAEAMALLVDDKNMREDLIRRGSARAARFLWDQRAPHFIHAITSGYENA